MAGKISKQKAIELILVELDKGSTYTDCFAVLCSNVQLSERAFANYWKIANQTYSERQQAIESELTEQRVELEKERLKTSIKTKNERVIILQSLISEIISELELNTCQDVDGKGKTFTRALLPGERTAMRKAIKDLQSEISKIEGDYAAIKQDVNMNGSITPENWLMLQEKK